MYQKRGHREGSGAKPSLMDFGDVLCPKKRIDQ